MHHSAEGDYRAALIALARLRKPVDAFFEAVLVMDKDDQLRCHRLALLEEISTLFHDLADFSKIVTEHRNRPGATPSLSFPNPRGPEQKSGQSSIEFFLILI